MAEHRHFTPAQVLDMTLPQIHAVYCGSKEEGTEELRGETHLNQILKAWQDREQTILDAMESGRIR